MKIIHFRVVLLLIAFHLSQQSIGQHSMYISFDIPVQVEFQKVEVTYGPYSLQKPITYNFGIGAAINYALSKRISVSAGLRYFRERFNVKRPYNHMLLNPGTDSLPILTKTTNYDYHLLGMPISISIGVGNTEKPIEFGISYVPNLAFKAVYNGSRPYATAKNYSTNFKYYSGEFFIVCRFLYRLPSNKLVGFSPYARIFNSYLSDVVLFESANISNTRTLDAFGVSFTYHMFR